MTYMVQLNYNDLSKSSGIYFIWNSFNWRTYIGSCKEFKTRWVQGHLKSLLGNKHRNRFLQADFNKCRQELGHDDFLEFHVLENMPGSTKTERLAEEEKWLDLAYDHGNKCYNLAKRAISREGSPSNTPEITRKLISENTRRQWADPEKKALILSRQKEKMKPGHMDKARKFRWAGPGNEERRETQGKRLREYWDKNPDLKEKAVERLAKSYPKARETFSKRMKEDVGFREKLVKMGKIQVSKINEKYKEDPGFKKKMDEFSIKNIQEYNKKKIQGLKVKPALVSPEGVVFNNITNACEFATTHKIDTSSIYKIFSRKLTSYRGWRLYLSGTTGSEPKTKT